MNLRPGVEVVVLTVPPEPPSIVTPNRIVSFPRFVTEEANRRWLEIYAWQLSPQEPTQGGT